MTISDIIPHLIRGATVTRKSSTVDRTIRYNRTTKSFHEGIQGIQDMIVARRIELTIDDLKAEDWELVNDGN